MLKLTKPRAVRTPVHISDVDKQTSKQANKQNKQANKHTNKQTEGPCLTHKYTNTQTHKRTDRKPHT